MDAEREREGTRARATQPTGTQVAEDDDHSTAPGRRRAPPPTKERTTARHALPPPPERNISEQSKHNVCNGLDENHDRTPATCHMVRLGPGAGDKDRRDRHYWATLNHDQKLAEALYGLTRAQEAVRRARAHKALADHAIDDAYVDGVGPRRRNCVTLWPCVGGVISNLPNTTASDGRLAVRDILTLATTCGVAAAETTRKLLARGINQAWQSWQWTTALQPWLHELEHRIDMLAITTAAGSGGAALRMYARMHALVPQANAVQPRLMHEDISAAFRHAEAMRLCIGGPRAALVKGIQYIMTDFEDIPFMLHVPTEPWPLPSWPPQPPGDAQP